jgi:hypothetical protein
VVAQSSPARLLVIVAAGVLAIACSEPPPRTPPPAPDLVIPPLGSAHAMLAARDDVPLEPVAPPPEASDATETEAATPATSGRTGCAADRAEIAAALARVDFRSCVKTPPPMDAERTHLRITFERTGLVAAASLEGPFRAGPTGTCMLERFRKLRVAPFCGPTITVGKNLRL